CASVAAQSDLTFSAQVRQRTELNYKDFDNETGPNNFSLLRSRIGLKFVSSEKVSAFFQVQDSRLFGEESNTLTDGSADNLDLHQAYFRIDDLFDQPLTLQVGRMEVAHSGQRLMGAVGWHNIGRSFDGAVLKYTGDKADLQAFGLKETENARLENEGDRNIYGLYAEIAASASQEVQPFFYWQQGKATNGLSRKTLGVNAVGKTGALAHTLELAYQWGSVGGSDISAFFAALNLNYTFAQARVKPVVGVGVDYLSGDDEPSDNESKVFNTLYATNHKFYGFMDYFLNIPAHTFGLGLTDLQVRCAINPAKNLKTSLAFHKFTASKEANLAGGASKDFGSELDLTLNHKYNKNATFVLGVSLFTPGDLFKAARGDDIARWVYVMTIVNL
ncbi:MAG: alginate export family protein, partial [bacterium]